jgi:acrylyl-CoA reductase (NADPH)
VAGELRPSHGPVLVTGAAGGLGQLAIAILKARGFDVIASSGRPALETHLRALGAGEVIGRLEPEQKPLAVQRWAGVVDSVGGATLAAAIAQTMYRGAVASTGVAGGGELASTVFPFILRGVRLLGVDSTMPWNIAGYPADRERWECWQRERHALWEELEATITPEALQLVSSGTIALEEVYGYSDKILAGKVAGRLVVEIGLEDSS